MTYPSVNELFDVRDKSIVITGATGVLCGEMARFLAAQGGRVAVIARDEGRGQKVVDDITAAGGTAICVLADILDPDSLKQARTKIVEAFDRIDVLINGAGGNRKEATTSPDLPFHRLDVDAIRDVFDVNALGTIVPCQVFGRSMVGQEAGVILNIASMASYQPLTNVVSYSAAKAAIANFTQWLAIHMAQNYTPDIRVNALAPGFFLTNQNRFLLTDEKTGELTARGRQIVDHTPSGRFGKPDELLGAVLWLVTDASKFVTGTIVPVDGGFNAYSGV